MAEKYPSTLLPQTNDPTEIQKAILDLLDKINKIQQQGTQVKAGTVEMWPSQRLKDGYLWCDGSTYRRVDYPELFAEIGSTFGAPDAATFKVPDYRGVSPTGAGSQTINGRTKTGPALGEVREDQMQSHKHTQRYSITSNRAPGANDWFNVNNDVNSGADTTVPVTDGPNGAPRTGPYTHGPEIGMNFIIKT